MLPMRCIQPPCMNMAEMRVAASAEGSFEKRTGMNAHSVMKASPR